MRNRWLRWTLAAAVVLACLPSAALAGQKGKPPSEDPEVRIGRENAAELEKDKSVRLVTDAALLDRVNRIGQTIAAIANTVEVPAHWGSSDVKKFDYTFKIVDDKDVNAFSLPGGHVYVNKGLLDYTHSDDELAGVLAHEIAHAAHHHMMKLLKEQSKMQPYIPLVLLAAVLAKAGGQDLSALALGGQLYMVAKLNGYGVEAEKDADATGMQYLMKTKYNPVAMLTFMERLARDELRGPERILGIYRTHPPSPERAKALEAELAAAHIPIDRTAADPALRAHVSEVTINGVPMAEVGMNKTVIARFAESEGLSGHERAIRFAASLDHALDRELQQFEIKLNADRNGIIARTTVLGTFAAEDAHAERKTVEQLAQDALDAIRKIMWQEQFDRIPANAGANW